MIEERNYQMGLKRILTVAILCTIQVFKSQVFPVNPGISNKSIPNIVSPEVNTLLRYDDFPDVGFIGGTDINIPIYEIKYDGLTIPISLSYNTKGAKVADIASNVGLGWTLNAGGSITMEANERYDFSGSFKKTVTGQFFPRTETLMAGCGFYGEYFRPDGGNPIGSANFIIDAAPDYYHISSPGLNDKFYLSKVNGEFEMKSLQNLKTRFLEKIKEPQDFDKFTTFIDYGGEVSYIIKKFNIKNENGFLYNFQNRVISKSPYPFSPNDTAAPSSWLLSSIQSPRKDNKVEFLYENFSNNYVQHSASVYQRINTGSVEISKIINSTPPPSANYIANPELAADQLAKVNYTRTRFENSQRLKTITFSEGSINFIYGASRMDYDGQVLSKIILKDLSGKEIKFIDFTYSYFQSKDANCSGKYNCLRLKLDQVYDSTLRNAYILSYGGQNPSDNLFPPRGSGKVDFLGFYKDNGSDVNLGINEGGTTGSSPYVNDANILKTNKIYFYPNLTRDYFIPFKLSNYSEESTTGFYDGSASSQSLIGLLTSIRYPTKGGLKIEYENDDFEYLGVNYILGSARIKSMEYFGILNNSLRKINYSYKNTDLKSTGQICFLIPPTDILRAEINNGYKNSAVVGYSKITQEEIGNGRTEKYYSNFNSYPDIYENITPTPSTTAQINFFKFFKFPGVFIQTMDMRRGQLIKEFIYNSLNDTVKKSIFDYQYFEKDSFETTKKVFEHTGVGSNPTNIFYAKNRFITYQNYLIKHTVEDLLNGKTIKSERIYTYDQPINLIKKQETISSENIEETTYKYAIDQNQIDLVNANMIGIPLLTESKKNSKTISKTETKYDKPYPSQLFPGSVLSYNLQNNNAEAEVIYDQYDTSGNLVQYTTKEGTPVTILWGYNNSHPIAKIEGIDFPHAYSTVLATAISKSNQDVDDSSEQDLIVALNNIRSNNLYKDYKITTYTYDPLIGIKSITPPSGIKENYKYDSQNRLEKIIDVNGNILKEYKYNYVATTYYNSERSGNFMKYCGGNGIGTTFTYTVAPNTYTSIISQVDADQKAQDDVYANGQNAANNDPNGTCTPISCSLSFNSSIGIGGGGGISVTPNSYYKISFGFSSGSNSTNLPWTTTGVKIATITGNCKPIADYSSYNGQVYYTIKTNGDVILKTQTSSALPNNTSYSYEFYFPIN